ncbi:amino acid adenylation domain-containing protein [Nocardia cyriacigeorgica]|uniref:non-ribosomal peptide synthetase n=1 Tax=Nocardia cyriacigeorgica TaxID=135487 RepID=UPI0018940D31|nr:non-ribosomal peptide synthetase [Nocardia cyriacigeorgica]MBF6343684.1 amino acid adenylation domain-containing protein [Nocardia cyriacigeorgica]MBF6516374.1 amino acid adenylation domain-containing protein [Nocardia cyriacigeorgica]
MADDIIERRKQLLQRRLREQNVKAAEPEPVPARTPGTPSPLSDAQRRMWFLQRLDPADTTLNVCVAYRLTGPLDTARLHAACASVLARHEILRTTYGVDADGEPFQVSSTDAELPWKEHDLSALPEAGRARRVEVLARREFARPFDLGVDLPVRATLARTGPDEHVLILVVHHIGWDDDSWPVFFAEVNAAYRGEQLAAPRAQYVDVEVGADTTDDADLAYWREALTPLPERVALPTRAAAGSPSKNAETLTRALPPELADGVAELARAHSTTPFTVLLAGFQALIHRYTAATDFLVSVPVVDRRAGAQQLIGYFGNAVLVRADLDGSTDFATLLDGVRDTCTGAFAHQGVGVDRVVREVGPERTAGRDAMAQLVQLSFSMRGDANGFDLDGVTAQELPLHPGVAQEELGLMVVAGATGTRVEATYLVDALDPAVVAQFLDHYVQLLGNALADPTRRLRDLDILGDAGRSVILAASQGALVDVPATTMVALFQDRVAAAPEADALISDAERLTYADLNRRANRLAHWLIRRGLGPEDLVALRMATSVEFIVATLAVLKAGAGYLPIDPAYPAERIDYLLTDAGPAIEWDAEGYASAEAEAAALPDTDPADADRVAPLRPANTAYVIYTSGSTGKPKGVPVPHDAIAEHLLGFTDEWDLTPQDRVLQSTSVSFDASLLDIYVTLTAGACVVVPKPNAYRDIAYVADLVTRHGVTVLHMVPSMLATFLVLPEANDWRSLRHVPVGGEALAGEIADRFATQFDAQLRNHYGPTEAVVSSTHLPVEGPQGVGVVPIGIPNQNVYLYLLDEALQLVPTGVAGEIYLGGNQLARGYLHRPALSAERFIADPFRPGQRLYRTGDLARRNAKGEIEFLGRADEQVKVRGFRIELGEVEATVTDHPDVAHCVVTVVEHPTLGPILAGYAVPEPGTEPDVEAVRAFVAARLPEHMVPATITLIDAVPLTAHGKLDKRALPTPELAVGRVYREPRTSTEIRVAALYAALFSRDRIGADDSFFELGGHSLLAARLITMIRAEFGIEIDMRVPFDKPTVAGLAAHLVAVFLDQFGIDLDELDAPGRPIGAVEADGPGPVPTPRQRPDHIPLSYSQRAYWMQRRMEGAIDGENVTYPIRFEGPLDRAALFAALDSVVARHESLRTSFPEHEGTPYQLIHPAGHIEVPVVQLHGDTDRLEQELAADAAYVFQLAGEPMLRLRLLVLDEQDAVLSILMHHIIADRSSCKIFVDDLTLAYRAHLRGEEPDWPELPIQFADFAIWQREVFDRGPDREVSAIGASQLDYWREALAGLPDEIAVGHDHPRPQVLGRNGISTARTLPASVWERARATAEAVGATEFMLCQAVGAVTLNALGAGEDLAIGAAVANRLDEATEQLIGLFANVVVLRNDVSGDPTPRTMLSRVRDNSLEALGRQGVPFERLVETLNPPRSLARNPLFQVMMHMRHHLAPTPFSADGATTVRDIAKFYDVSFMDFHLDYTVDVTGDLIVRVVVNPDLYLPATGEIFADTVIEVLTAFAERADQPLSELDLTPAGWDTSRSVVHMTPAPVTRPAGGSDEPLTETERTLITLLAELLEIDDVDEIGREDGFFGLGGDSVIAIQWATRAGEAGLPLTPQMVFEYFTIVELAAAVDEAIANPPADSVGDDHRHEAMSVSGLDAGALAALEESWAAQN